VQEIPECFRKHLTSSLLGRLKLILFERMTGSPNHLPDPRQARLFLIDHFRSDSTGASLWGMLLNLSHCQVTEYDSLPDASTINDVLRDLEMNPLDDPFFLEIGDCPKPWPSPLGVLLYREDLADGGYVYTAILFSAEAFPDNVIGHAEIRASQAAPEPAFAVLRSGRYETFSRATYVQDATSLLFAKILKCMNENRFRRLVPLGEAVQIRCEGREDTKPPPDPQFDGLLRLVLLGKMQCAEAQIQTAFVKPHDLHFALAFPLDVVNQSVRSIKRGLIEQVLVYWDGFSFVMSDCYPSYLAYRKLNYRTIPTVVMGPFPEGLVNPKRVGGVELIPPIIVGRRREYESFSPELKDFMLDIRLTKQSPSDAVFGLYSLFMQLADLIRDPHTKEGKLHDLLLRNPVAIDPFGLGIRTEVRLGNDYRVDLLIQYEYSDKRILLIELERADISIFTQKGRPRAQVTHSIQQVEDWLRWWRENPSKVPDGLDGSVPVEGLVVIGRSADMTEDDRRRLLGLNHTRLVQVITYDDLLDRIRSLIVTLEQNEETQ
jgi:hypothetical protein